MHESYDTPEQTYLLHNFYLLSFHKCSFIPKIYSNIMNLFDTGFCMKIRKKQKHSLINVHWILIFS